MRFIGSESTSIRQQTDVRISLLIFRYTQSTLSITISLIFTDYIPPLPPTVHHIFTDYIPLSLSSFLYYFTVYHPLPLTIWPFISCHSFPLSISMSLFMFCSPLPCICLNLTDCVKRPPYTCPWKYHCVCPANPSPLSLTLSLFMYHCPLPLPKTISLSMSRPSFSNHCLCSATPNVFYKFTLMSSQPTPTHFLVAVDKLK